jgi:hypothetical protein
MKVTIKSKPHPSPLKPGDLCKFADSRVFMRISIGSFTRLIDLVNNGSFNLNRDAVIVVDMEDGHLGFVRDNIGVRRLNVTTPLEVMEE